MGQVLKYQHRRLNFGIRTCNTFAQDLAGSLQLSLSWYLPQVFSQVPHPRLRPANTSLLLHKGNFPERGCLPFALCHKHFVQSHRITEYSELEGTHKDH